MPGVPSPPSPLSARCDWHSSYDAAARCAGCERPACVYCLSDADAPGYGPGEAVRVGVCPVCAPVFGVPSSVPFEHAERSSWGGFFTTWGWAIAKPNQLWTSFPHAGVGRASLFALLSATPVALLFSCCFGGIFTVVALEATGPLDPEARTALMIGLAVIWGITLCTPLFVALFSLPVHLCAKIGKSDAPWSATYRMLCYLIPIRVASIPATFVLSIVGSIVPIAGPVFSQFLPEIWHSMVLYHGVRRVHGVSHGAATVAVIVAPLSLCVFTISPLVIMLMLLQ